MKRLLKWLLPTLIFVEVALVWFGMLNLKEAAFIVGGIETLILLTGIGEVLLMVQRYRKDRSSSLDF